MNKDTMEEYGWIVVAVVVLSCVISLATPFGEYIADAINAIVSKSGNSTSIH